MESLVGTIKMFDYRCVFLSNQLFDTHIHTQLMHSGVDSQMQNKKVTAFVSRCWIRHSKGTVTVMYYMYNHPPKNPSTFQSEVGSSPDSVIDGFMMVVMNYYFMVHKLFTTISFLVFTVPEIENLHVLSCFVKLKSVPLILCVFWICLQQCNMVLFFSLWEYHWIS